MLTIKGTNVVSNDYDKPTEEATTKLPNSYYLELTDKADNPYEVIVTKDVYDTINQLQAHLKDTEKFS